MIGESAIDAFEAFLHVRPAVPQPKWPKQLVAELGRAGVVYGMLSQT